MKIRLLTDLHLDFVGFKYERLDEDVLVLAGDIGEGFRGAEWIRKNIPLDLPVIYVPGNHEYYGHDIPVLNKKLTRFRKLSPNVVLCPFGTWEKDGVLFIGHTMFTDFNLYGNAPLHAECWRKGLNDALYIIRKGRKIGVDLMPRYFRVAQKWVRKILEETEGRYDKRILVTHYCPEWSIAPKYKEGPALAQNPGFAARWDPEIVERVDVIMHGHTHDVMKYELGNGTKVFCNPRGYGNEKANGFNANLIIEV